MAQLIHGGGEAAPQRHVPAVAASTLVATRRIHRFGGHGADEIMPGVQKYVRGMNHYSRRAKIDSPEQAATARAIFERELEVTYPEVRKHLRFSVAPEGYMEIKAEGNSIIGQLTGVTNITHVQSVVNKIMDRIELALSAEVRE